MTDPAGQSEYYRYNHLVNLAGLLETDPANLAGTCPVLGKGRPLNHWRPFAARQNTCPERRI